MHSVLEILAETPDSAGPDLISLDDLKAALGITGTAEDAALQSAITFQSRIIAEYCDRRFGLAQALETFTFDHDAMMQRREVMYQRQALTLSLYPVVEITDVSIAGATSGDFDFDPTSGRLWLWKNTMWANAWWVGMSTVAVTYSGGYDLPEEAPARLARAVVDAVNAERTSGSRDPGIREVQHGDTRISYYTPGFSTASSGFLPATAVDLIRPYRRLTVA